MSILKKLLLIFFAFVSGSLFIVWFFGNFWQLELVLILFLSFVLFLYIYYLVKDLLGLIKKSALIIEKIAIGNLNEKIDLEKKSEVSQIHAHLNNLMDRLKSGVTIDISMNSELDQAKSDFVSLASHQLRTPLSIVKWYVDYLLSGDAGELNEEQKKYLTEIFGTNQRMIDLVNALLDVSRIDLGTFSIEPEQTDIIAKADEAIDKYKSLIGQKEIIFEKNFEKMPLLKLDPRLILIVLENILSNAIKYTPDGGRVRFTIKKDNDDILIMVSDTGVGVSPDQRSKMFSKMFRAADAKKMVAGGNGLGLYISKAVIEKSGGRIWFESPSTEFFFKNDDKKTRKVIADREIGTTFFITIPLKGMKKKIGTKNLENIE